MEKLAYPQREDEIKADRKSEILRPILASMGEWVAGKKYSPYLGMDQWIRKMGNIWSYIISRKQHNLKFS